MELKIKYRDSSRGERSYSSVVGYSWVSKNGSDVLEIRLVGGLTATEEACHILNVTTLEESKSKEPLTPLFD